MEKKVFIIIGTITLIAIIVTSIIIFQNNNLKKENLKVGVGGEFPPFSYYDENNKLTGLDIELIKEIAKRMEMNVEFIAIPWVEIFDEVKDKNVDIIIDAITITPERSQEMLFSDSYFLTGQSLVIKENNIEINSAKDLENKKVGTQVGSTGMERVMGYAKNIQFITYDNAFDSIEPLKRGTIDAIVVDFEVANKWVKNDNKLKISGDLLSEEYYGIAMDRNNMELMEKINNILREMKNDGTLDKLKEKWIN
ncbi:transporter substrate-binding domain-containing protein [Candidatus Pacearchaeota archaeon]|nr:transporter substrate-binding domain-containing protein [Candidatus Pacearchaeota archaeon]